MNFKQISHFLRAVFLVATTGSALLLNTSVALPLLALGLETLLLLSSQITDLFRAKMSLEEAKFEREKTDIAMLKDELEKYKTWKLKVDNHILNGR